MNMPYYGRLTSPQRACKDRTWSFFLKPLEPGASFSFPFGSSIHALLYVCAVSGTTDFWIGAGMRIGGCQSPRTSSS